MRSASPNRLHHPFSISIHSLLVSWSVWVGRETMFCLAKELQPRKEADAKGMLF
jgi:hypothetical protein